MADPALSPGSNPGLAPVSTEPVIPTVPYEIQKGDSLSVIAQRYKTSIATLQKLNGLQGTFIRYGQTIRVPAPEGAATAAPPQPEATAPGIPAGFGTAAPAPTETSVPPPTSGTGVRGGDTGFGFGGSSTPRPRTPSADDDFLNLPAPQ